MVYRSELAEQLGAVIGEESFVRLCRAWPGVPVYVPLAPSEDHPLVRALGTIPAQALCAEFGGCTIIPPRMAAERLASRNAMIRAARGGGKSAAQLARQYDMHIRQIWNVLAGNDVPERNLSFDF